ARGAGACSGRVGPWPRGHAASPTRAPRQRGDSPAPYRRVAKTPPRRGHTTTSVWARPPHPGPRPCTIETRSRERQSAFGAGATKRDEPGDHHRVPERAALRRARPGWADGARDCPRAPRLRGDRVPSLRPQQRVPEEPLDAARVHRRALGRGRPDPPPAPAPPPTAGRPP